MKLKQTMLSLGLFATLASGAAPAAGSETYKCKGAVGLAVRFGGDSRETDLTQVKTREGTFTFHDGYTHGRSPHYRWGYEERHQALLLTPGGANPFGKVYLSVEYRGPTYGPNGEYGYHVRGISGRLELSGEFQGEKNPVLYLSCRQVLE